jgi:hypothetical protein
VLKQQTRSFIYYSSLFTLLALTFSHCDEELPSYREPSKFLSATIDGKYVFLQGDNSLKVYLNVTNHYEETLQDKALFNGSITIVSQRDPNVQKTLSLNGGNVITAKGYDVLRGILTIDPGENITLGVTWDFKDDQGRDLRTSFFTYVQDPNCTLRCLAFTEDFTLQGNVTLFAHTGPVFSNPATFALCFVSRLVSGRFCQPLNTGGPCNLRPPQPFLKPCVPTDFEERL